MSKSIHICFRAVVWSYLISCICWSCSNSDKKVSEAIVNEEIVDPITRLKFEQNFARPLPVLVSDLPANLSSGNKANIQTHARSWDMNADGRIDMVEFWSYNGDLVLRTCDFDGNGEPEFQHRTGH